MSVIPGVIYTLDRTNLVWKAAGRQSLPASSRAELPALYGTYVPDASTTGHIGTPLTSIYVSQAGAASTSSAAGLGGRWTITSALGLQTVVINGTPRSMVVLENLDIHGMVRAEVPVFMNNCRVRGRSGGTKVAGQWWSGFEAVHPGAAGSYIIDTTFQVDSPTELHMAGVNGGAGVTLVRCNISGGVDGCRFGDVNQSTGANMITASWLHDMQFINGTFAPQPEGPHCDVVQYSPNIPYAGVQRIEYSYLNARMTGHPTDGSNGGPSCIMIPGATDNAFTLQIEDSWLEWGWFPINAGGTPHASSSITMTNVKARPGWFTASGVTYHSVETTAWQAKVSKTNCTDWDTGGAWRRRNG